MVWEVEPKLKRRIQHAIRTIVRTIIIQVLLAIGFVLLFNREFRGKSFFIIIILLGCGAALR